MRKLFGSCPGRLKLASRCACARVSFEIGQRSMSGHRADGPVRVRSLAPRQRGGTVARRVVHKKRAAFQRYLPGWWRAGDGVEGCCAAVLWAMLRKEFTHHVLTKIRESLVPRHWEMAPSQIT